MKSEWKSSHGEMFRSKLSEDIFVNKYKHQGCETWDDLCRTLVEEVVRDRINKEDRDDLIKYMREGKFFPGGRYLYYAGRPVKFYNNCLSKDTNVLTDEGWRKINNLGFANVISPVDGKAYRAEFKEHGIQQLQLIKFKTLRGRQNKTWEVKATRTHHWPLIDGTDTYDLRVGDVVPSNVHSCASKYSLGFTHGFIFGDGNANGQARVCGDKTSFLWRMKPHVTISYPYNNGDASIYCAQDIKWKELPETNNAEYVASFIEGWLAADGGNVLTSIHKEHLEWFERYSAFAGITCTGCIRSQVRDVSIGDYEYKDHEIFILNYSKGSSFSGYKVIDIIPLEEELVYCPYEPIHNRIIIDGNIDTYQCYLLRSNEDTREDWADLSWKAESCLLTGGGIGNDYSIYRDSKQTVRRTGGRASGPLPKMYMVNELGRNVMQGGSRRSAIYASLNWKHGDIYEFLRAKDWHSMKVPGTDKTLWDLKQEDFNFPAPLDMTNISVNYDTEWIENYFKTGEYGDVFIKNVEQALRTGEPGFSFNFWDKENETLRNAPITGKTRVLTDKGYVSCYTIVGIPTTVWTGKRWAKNVVFNKTKEKADLVRVCLSNGRYIECDPSHPFIVWTKQGEVRIAASCLKEGMSIVSFLPSYQEIDEENRYGYGFVFGDGSIRQGRGEISYHVENKKGSYERACALLNARYSKVSPNRAYFDADIKYKEFERSRSFVAGWFDADGCFSHVLSLSNKDKSVLVELSEYLDTLGIQSTIKQEKTSGYGSESYKLIVFKNSWNTFRSLIPTLRVIPEQVSSCRTQNIKVSSIEHLDYKEDVYCCDVGVEEHSFMAEGVIISNCTEVTSEDDSDVCNLASINMARVEDIEEFSHIVELGTVFLLCGTIEAMLPYEKVYKVREKNRRLGLGLMGVHEWLIRRGSKYEVTPELHQWLSVYRGVSNDTARKASAVLGISTPKACRAIAPTGTISMLAGTTSGIEPLYAVSYKRRYLVNGNKWRYQYAVDNIAHDLINEGGIDPDKIESAIDLAVDYERRIKFQADVQDYVDMSISSTINLPTFEKQEFSAKDFADTLAKYAPRLRGFTCYPDGARGGQPLTRVDYVDAVERLGEEFDEHVEVNDVCSITGKGGSCGS